MSEIFLILRRMQPYLAAHVQYIGCHVKCPLFLSDFNNILIFSANFQEQNPQTPRFMKISPVTTELIRADRQTNITKLKVAFRSFANEPKNNNFNLLFGNTNSNNDDYGNNSTTLKIRQQATSKSP